MSEQTPRAGRLTLDGVEVPAFLFFSEADGWVRLSADEVRRGAVAFTPAAAPVPVAEPPHRRRSRP